MDATATPGRKPRIVILGGGFAGAYCAQALEKELRREGGPGADVLLIDRKNYFIFYPLLVEAGTGGLHPRHVVVSIRSYLKSTRFLMADAVGLDPQRREVTVRVAGEEATRAIAYDHVVLALGSVNRTPPIPGLKEHGFEMRSLPDAVGLRDRAIQLLEQASAAREAGADPAAVRALLHFIVVGGNYTGVEIAGEFHAYLQEAVRDYRNLAPGDCAVTLLELSDRILPTLDPELSDAATGRMRRRGIDVRLKDTITEVRPDGVTLRSGGTLASRTVIWAAGIAPPPLLANIALPKDQRGYLLCERDLRAKGFNDVWGIGDCAVNVDAEGKAYPATAQHAVKQGKHLAKNIARVLRGRPTTPCDIQSQGMLAAFGLHDAVAKVGNFKLRGFPAWFLWRSVYLMKMPGLARGARIALDWTADLLFGRDFVQLGVHRDEAEERRETTPVPPAPAAEKEAAEVVG